MKRFVEGVDRGQSTLFPECLEDWITKTAGIRIRSTSRRKEPPNPHYAAHLKGLVQPIDPM
jgi:hypothetical protein